MVSVLPSSHSTCFDLYNLDAKELGYTKVRSSPEYESLSFEPVDDAYTYQSIEVYLYTPHIYKALKVTSCVSKRLTITSFSQNNPETCISSKPSSQNDHEM